MTRYFLPRSFYIKESMKQDNWIIFELINVAKKIPTKPQKGLFVIFFGYTLLWVNDTYIKNQVQS